MAGLSGFIAAGLFALCAIRLRGDQVIIGTAMTLLALGLTEVIYQRLFGVTGIAQGVPAFQQIEIHYSQRYPFSDVPCSHTIFSFSSHSYSCRVSTFFFTTHKSGLRVRACGEHPRAIAAAGANVLRLRTVCLLFAGAMAGIAVGIFHLLMSVFYTRHDSRTRVIALAIVIFGKWHPVKACGAALLFGLGTALDARFQALGWDIPYQVF